MKILYSHRVVPAISGMFPMQNPNIDQPMGCNSLQQNSITNLATTGNVLIVLVAFKELKMICHMISSELWFHFMQT